MVNMSRKPNANGWISTVEQMKAIASPVRHQIHLALEMLGPCSIRDLASRMSRQPATLYYHVNMMERAGVLVRYGVRDTGRHAETIYMLAEKRIRLDMTQRTPRFLDAVTRGFASLLRYAERTLATALKSETTTKTGKASELRIRQVNVRLTRNKLVELNRRLDDLQSYIDDADSPSAKSTYAITICLSVLP